MTAQGQEPSGYSTGTLLLAAGSSALAGLALGYTMTKRGGRKGGRFSPNKLLLGARPSLSSADSTPAATPRSLSQQDSALGSGLKMLLLVRTDVPLNRPEVAEQAARAVLGIFKKLYKRKDASLRPWEEGGHRIKVLGVDSQSDMLLQQAAARALTIPTHTFASNRISKQRTVMAIGPAPVETLEHITGHLRELVG